MASQTVLVLDFGGQYNQLIARRVRECSVYCEVRPYTTPVAEIKAMAPIGIIFTGGPNSVYDPASPQADPEIFKLGIPILGICYGCQLIAHNLGGRVTAATADSAREYGKTETYFRTDCKLFKGLPAESVTWMSHGDYMEKVPEGFELVAHSDACPNVAICDERRGFYGVQFHPEVNHTAYGTAMLRNFLYEVCGAKGQWTMGDYKEVAIRQIREKVGDGKVLLALSGGVDSSVAAALIAEAVGNQLTCVFVDHGLMRLNEGDEVEEAFRKWDINFVRVNAEELFLSKLAGVSEPERKRKIIGEEFIGEDSVCLVLGDNIFHGSGFSTMLREAVRTAEEENKATVFGYWVDDPERYGVAEFDGNGNCLSIEEKPANPKSNYAVVGLYFYPNKVVDVAKKIKPSARGELEITTVNQVFLQDSQLKVQTLGRGFAWLDTGTHDSLAQASIFVEVIEKRQGLKIACLEGIAYRMGWISEEKMRALAQPMIKNQYGQYLLKVIDELKREQK